MAETALDRFERILQILPLAARDEGVSYAELAERLATTREQLEKDLSELLEREYYHPAGSGTDIQLGIDTFGVRAWTTGGFRRPTRLAAGEAAALDLGLRLLAAEAEDDAPPEGARRLLEQVARSVPADALDHVAMDGDPDAGDAVRALLVDAAHRRRRCSIRYLKPGADAPEDRRVDPYAVVYAEGRWYVIGWSPERDAVRVFRVDRVLEASVCGEGFSAPGDFDVGDYLDGRRVFRADDEVEVTVRFSARVAPWVVERGESEQGADGSVVARYRVADPRWLVRQVLAYGPEAEVVGPEQVRTAVAMAVDGAPGRDAFGEARAR